MANANSIPPNGRSPFLLKNRLTATAVLAMILGGCVGLWLGPKAGVLGSASLFIVALFKWIAIPILFTAILDTLLNSTFKGRGVFLLILVCLLNTTGAISIALFLSNTLELGRLFPIPTELKAMGILKTSWLAGLSSGLESNKKVELLNLMTITIGVSLVLGLSLVRLRGIFPQPVGKASLGIHHLLEFLFKMIHGLVYLIPIAIFCSVAKSIGQYGFAIVHGLMAYLFLCLLGMGLQIALVYQFWIGSIAKMKLKTFWHEAKSVTLYAFGINSSLATLPVTLHALKQLKVSDSSARLSACIGTNFNNDGILLYEVAAALFLVQAFGLDLSLPQQILLAGIAVIAGLGVAGIPEAGIISLTLVLSAVGLPIEVIATLMSVDWIIARCRSATNVLGDMTCAIAIDSLSSRNTK